MMIELINKFKLFRKEFRKESGIINIDDEDLLPCPFCGARAFVQHNVDFDDINGSGNIFIRRIICYTCHIGTLYFREGNEKRMVEKWNKRVVK